MFPNAQNACLDFSQVHHTVSIAQKIENLIDYQKTAINHSFSMGSISAVSCHDQMTTKMLSEV